MTIRYAADLVPEIANDIVNIDRAMRWGFGWQQGPFELVDRIGAARLIDRYQQDATPVPKMLRVLDDMGETHLYRSDGREFLTWQGLWETVSD